MGNPHELNGRQESQNLLLSVTQHRKVTRDGLEIGRLKPNRWRVHTRRRFLWGLKETAREQLTLETVTDALWDGSQMLAGQIT
jgi:hypothetical protein